MRIVLLGAPGSGKGTQSRKLSEKYNVPQISTGDLLRAAIKAKTKIGKQAKSAMETGELVADDLVLELIEERLQEADTKPGFLLDGFPRNIPQAQSLDRLLNGLGRKIQIALNIHVEQRELMKRITGRIVCGNCGEIFNDFTRKPKTPGVCDACGEKKLAKREDDNETLVKARLETYQVETEPLIVYYRAQQKLRTVKGSGKSDEITRKICDVIDADLRPLGARGSHAEPKAPEPIRIVLPPSAEEIAAAEEAKRKEEAKAEAERLKIEKKAEAERLRAEKKAAAEKAREEKRKLAEKKKAAAAKKKAADAIKKQKLAAKKKAAAEKKKKVIAKKKEMAQKKAAAIKKKKDAAAMKKKKAAAKKKVTKKVSKKKVAKKAAKKVAKKKATKKVAKKAAKKVAKKKAAKKVAKKAAKKKAKKKAAKKKRR